ncbi:YtxH domain-containing protein [Siminovitchia sediminis]|uniref:YtxH domain-containing protein n=1 Tax=Siminovitchia sediminis TaxID=1274353 RepID=A0ABW4KF92_9BACI
MAKMNPYVLLGLGVAGAFLSSKENRDKAMEMVGKAKDKAADLMGSVSHDNANLIAKVKEKAANLMGKTSENEQDLVIKAGRPEPYDIEDTKMVDEGAQYGVKYYNEEVQQQH